MRKTDKKRKGFSEVKSFIDDKLTLPSDALEGSFSLEIRERRTVFVRGCRRIVKYSEDEMIIAVRGFEVRIRGQGLTCSTYHCGAVTVDGEILGVDIGEWEGKE
jgi:hypothetical protein